MGNDVDNTPPYQGRVLAPAEYRQLLRTLGHHAEIGQHGVVARMSAAMQHLIAAGGRPHGGAALFITPPRWSALVVTVQVGPCQSRVALDLHDPLARAYLDSALRYQGLAVVLVNPAYPAVAHYVAEFTSADPLASLPPPEPLPLARRRRYLSKLGTQLGEEPGLITLGLTLPVEEVTVTLVRPGDRHPR